MRLFATLALCIAVGATPAAADDLTTRVLVMPITGEGTPPPSKLTDVTIKAAQSIGSRAARAAAGLDDTALLIGCDVATPQCLDGIAAQLNVDQLIFGVASKRDGKTFVEITATARQKHPIHEIIELPPAGAEAFYRSRIADLLTRLGEAPLAQPEAPTPSEPPPPPPAPAPEPVVVAPLPPPPPAPAARPLWAWITTGVGIATAGAGVLVWSRGRAMQSDIDDAPTNTAEELRHLEGLEDDANLRLKLGGGMAIGGVVLAGVGTFFLIRSGGERTTVAATPELGGGSFVVTTRF